MGKTLLSVVLLFGGLYSYPEGWSNDILISPDTAGRRDRPDIITDSEDNVWAVWDSAGWSGGYIYYTKRDSMGNCLLPETPVSTSGYSRYSRIEVDAENNIHFVWRELSPQGYGLGYTKIASNGSVLVPPHLAVNGAGGGGPIAMEIAIDAWDDMHIIWQETPLDDQINYTLLNNNGDTLVSRLRVSPPDTNCHYPGICVDNAGNNHICFRADCPPNEWLMYTKIGKNGDIIVPYTIVAEGGSPSLVCDIYDNVHVFYVNPVGPGNSIYYLKLGNNGNILVPPMCVSLPIYNSWACHGAIDSDQYLHIVWDEDRSREFAWIVYTKMDTMATVITPPLDIVFPPHTFWSISPRIAVDNSNRLHVVWIDGRVDTVARIYYKRGENEPGVHEIGQLLPREPLNIIITPNLFREKVDIRWHIPGDSKIISLEIFDISGRPVKDFSEQTSRIGRQSALSWDGKDGLGHVLPGGVYFLKFQVGDYSTTEKVLLIR